MITTETSPLHCRRFTANFPIHQDNTLTIFETRHAYLLEFYFAQQSINFLWNSLWYFNHHDILHTISSVLNDIRLKTVKYVRQKVKHILILQDMRNRIITFQGGSAALNPGADYVQHRDYAYA